MVNLPGVKQGSSGEYYYSDDDVKMITVPIGQCQGDFNLHPEELKKYFGVEQDRMGTLPQYLITPLLVSTKSAEQSWWVLTGDVVVYQPLEWVPIVPDLGTISASVFEKEFERKTTTIETSQIYGNDAVSFKVGPGLSWKGMKLDVSNTTTVGVSYSINKEVHKEIMERGKYGELLVKKVALGIGLKVKRVFEHGVKLYINTFDDTLNWYIGFGSWNDISVLANAMRDVFALRFHRIKMSGYNDLSLQVLPVFNSNRTLTDMHVVFTSGWDRTGGSNPWYAYLDGSKVVNGGRVETIALPDNKPPLVTFMLLTPTNPTQTEKKAFLSGVKQSVAVDYYYNDSDFKLITVPIGECQGDFNLRPDELKKYFGVDFHQMGSLPEYLITPLLNNTRNNSRSSSSGRSWWDITGEVVVYQPLEWVPIVRELETITANAFEREFEKKTTTLEQWQIYGKDNKPLAMEASIGGKFINLKDIKNIPCKVNHSITEEVQREIVEKGKHGLLVIKKVVLGMGLKVKRVFEHGVKLYLNDEEKSDSLTWDGLESWNDIRISRSALRNVFDLMHYPFGRLMENIPTNSLKLLPLPVFNAQGTVTDMHVVLGPLRTQLVFLATSPEKLDCGYPSLSC